MDLCEICNSAETVGQCSRCGRWVCPTHLVLEAYFSHDYRGTPFVRAVFAGSGHDVVMQNLRHPESFGATRDSVFENGWVEGTGRCTECRWRAGLEAVAKASAASRAEFERMVAECDAARGPELRDKILSYALYLDHAELWRGFRRLAADSVLPPSHMGADIMGRKGFWGKLSFELSTSKDFYWLARQADWEERGEPDGRRYFDVAFNSEGEAWNVGGGLLIQGDSEDHVLIETNGSVVAEKVRAGLSLRGTRRLGRSRGPVHDLAILTVIKGEPISSSFDKDMDANGNVAYLFTSRGWPLREG